MAANPTMPRTNPSSLKGISQSILVLSVLMLLVLLMAALVNTGGNSNKAQNTPPAMERCPKPKAITGNWKDFVAAIQKNTAASVWEINGVRFITRIQKFGEVELVYFAVFDSNSIIVQNFIALREMKSTSTYFMSRIIKEGGFKNLINWIKAGGTQSPTDFERLYGCIP
jgi:hypothetical protein